MGNSDPPRNQGTIAIAGTRAMYSAGSGTRLARVSAAPYIPTVNIALAARNHAIPLPVASKGIPRATAATMRAVIWNAVTAKATARLPSTSVGRGTGRGEQLALRAGLSVNDHAQSREHRVERNEEPDRPHGDERLVRRARMQRLFQGGRDHEREQDGGQQRNEQLARRPNRELRPTPRERRDRREDRPPRVRAVGGGVGDGGHVGSLLFSS